MLKICVLKLACGQIFLNRHKKWVKDKQNQKSFGSLYSVKNIDIFEKVLLEVEPSIH